MTAPAGSRPRVSVVVPTYQRASLLAKTLPQILAQTLTDIEVIVADDGSTDDTPTVTAAIDDPRVVYLRRDHLGMPGILNEGLSRARGAYVMTCHDHDIYEPTLLAELAALLDRHPTAAYAHCGILVVDGSGERVLERYVRDYPELFPGRRFLAEHLLPRLDSRVTALTMVRASALAERLPDPAFGPVADIELWLRLCLSGDVAYVPTPLIRVRQRDTSSQNYAINCRLMTTVLDLKRMHLRYVEEPGTRAAIEAGWRRGANRAALLEVLRALRQGRRDDLPRIAEFARREGTPAGAAVTALLCRAPAIAAIAALQLLRGVARGARFTTALGRASSD